MEEGLYGLALTAERVGSFEEAVQLWTEFLATFPDSEWSARAQQNLASLREEDAAR